MEENSNDIQKINNGDYFCLYMESLSYLYPGLTLADNTHTYNFYRRSNANCIKYNLIFKKIDDHTAIEIGSRIKFNICDIGNLPIVAHTKEEFLELDKKFKERPLVLDSQSSCEKLTDILKELYLANFEKNMKYLRNSLTAIKKDYEESQEVIMDRLYNLAIIDDMIYECDKRYALKSDE